MASDIQAEISQAKQKVKELSAVISVYAAKPVTREVKAKEQELKDRLTYRLAELQLQAFKTKAAVMTELIDLLKANLHKL